MASLRAAKLAGKPHKHPGTGDSPSEKRIASSSAPPPALPCQLASSFPSSRSAPDNGGNLDTVLFQNLVDMVPLVESLMDRRANQSFRRRASLVYTPTPSNTTNARGEKTAQNGSVKKQSDHGVSDLNKLTNKMDGTVDFSTLSSKALIAEDVQKDVEELNILREKLDDLHKKLVEKDEALTSLKESTREFSTINATLDELKQQILEKDTLIANANSQLANTEVKIAEKQAALEKLECEVMNSNEKVEELQGDLDSIEFEIAAFKKLFEELSKECSHPDDNIPSFEPTGQLSYINNIDENEVLNMEEARVAYIAAVAAAKDDPSDEFLAAAAEARLHLQSFLKLTTGIASLKASSIAA